MGDICTYGKAITNAENFEVQFDTRNCALGDCGILSQKVPRLHPKVNMTSIISDMKKKKTHAANVGP